MSNHSKLAGKSKNTVMIKLTLTPQTQPISYIFEKSRIVIGKSLSSVQPDLPLAIAALLPEHLAIEEIDGQFLIINTANDPFTTLNGHPFGKKFLSNGDLILIDSIAIRFEGTPNKTKTASPPVAIPNIDHLLRRVEELKMALIEAGAIPTESSPDPIFDQEPAPPSCANLSALAKLERKSLKDDYLHDLDDENDSDSALKSANSANPRFIISWKALFTFMFGFLIFCSAAFAIFYLSMIDRSQKEEIKVAAAVADVVMALNFAQLNHALPHNQNWSDPDFLKHNLTAVLANGYQPLANIDSHGQFHETSYILRIYTSSDLGHFLVIAQPNANLLQWLVPKSAIIVDSQLMELRKTTDLKTLNRLLVDPTLDNNNSDEIAYLVGQGTLITFDEINQAHKDSSFSIPKALTFIRPGAENLIYNALRYYRFGESLSKNAISLYETRDNQYDVSHMLQEIDAFMKLKNIVLYSSGGLQTAMAVQKALGIFAPQHKFLFGYVQVSTKGLAHSGHLLIDDNSSAVAELNKPEISIHAYPHHSHLSSDFQYLSSNHTFDELLPSISKQRDASFKEIEEKIIELISAENRSALPDFTDQLAQLLQQHDIVDLTYQAQITNALNFLSLVSEYENNEWKNDLELVEIETQEKEHPSEPMETKTTQAEQKHPLYYKLAALHDLRQQKLKLINSEISKLAEEQADRASVAKQEKINILNQNYLNTDQQMQEMIVREVSNLHHTYSQLPLTEFMTYVKSAGLESIVQGNLHNIHPRKCHYSNEEFTSELETIKSADSLLSLNQGIHQIAESLSMECVPSTDLLIAFQNAVHTEVLLKLDLFLLSPDKRLKNEELQDQNRPLLENILQSAWISDQDEIDYYLNEFDLLASTLSNPS